jgi:uncharacterized protein (DUF1015 family)
MATIRPFPALRPQPQLASQVCELPYDVMSSEEARALASGNPLSFLHVSKPEIDLPAGTDLYSPEVYAKGRENFQKLIRDGVLRQDRVARFYIYRQVMGTQTQAGIVAVASVEEYLAGTIKKHELTRVDKEDDRVRHIETLASQTGPVFLTYRASVAIDALVNRRMAEQPDVDFTAPDGVRHTSWIVSPEQGDVLEREFAKIPALYIADGHHRSAAAARVYRAQRSNPNAAWFLTVIFPHNQMQILPYNRVLKDLNGLTPEQLLEKLDGVFVIQKNSGAAKPERKHFLGLFLCGQWHTLTFREHFARTSDPIEKLDVTLLQRYVLDPIFGINDPRTSKRIQFVGGIRGTAELEKLVNSGEFACAFSMYPTSIEDLMTIADAGGIMPPKSTWFEPKLRDAMFCHMI